MKTLEIVFGLRRVEASIYISSTSNFSPKVRRASGYRGLDAERIVVWLLISRNAFAFVLGRCADVLQVE
jgi:hypothetical protein